MKKTVSKKMLSLHIDDANELKLLQKKAKFLYVDNYVGPQAKPFSRVFKQPAFQRLLKKYAHPDIQVGQIALLGGKGFGVIASQNLKIPKGKKELPMGIYWGLYANEVKTESPYIFTISKHEIDARKHGNWTRFVNHSKTNYNVVANQKTRLINGRKLSYIEYALCKDVKAGDQLLVDYGPDYEFEQKDQLFFNPSNGVRTAQEIYLSHKNEYVSVTGKLLTTIRKLYPQAEKIFAPKYYLSLLLAKKISAKNKVNSHPELPLLLATRNGVILSDQHQDDLTVLMLASYMGMTKVVNTLIKQEHANVNQQTIHSGMTALFYAVKSECEFKSQLAIVNALLKAGESFEAHDHDGFTFLHWCVNKGNLPLLKALFANKKYHSKMIEMLSVLDRDDYCPIALAIDLGKVEMADYLLRVYEKYHDESLFHPRQNDWLIPTVKKMIQHYAADNFPQMFEMLCKHRLMKNRKVNSVLQAIIKRRLLVS